MIYIVISCISYIGCWDIAFWIPPQARCSVCFYRKIRTRDLGINQTEIVYARSYHILGVPFSKYCTNMHLTVATAMQYIYLTHSSIKLLCCPCTCNAFFLVLIEHILTSYFIFSVYRPAQSESDDLDGWNVYTAEREYGRQGNIYMHFT